MHDILVLNGPNLNMLGIREPSTYGHATLEEIGHKLQEKSRFKLVFFQSNAEDALIERIQQAYQEKIKFIIFNPAAFTHTSIALRDALLATAIPFIEVHLSNIYKRESFRHHSYFSDIAQGVISGLGAQGYELALLAAEHFLSNISR